MTHILKKGLHTLLVEIEDNRRDTILKIYADHEELFHQAKGSSHNHQAWVVGYADHITECLQINNVIYVSLENIRPLPFTKDSAAIALFLHDIEKPFRYGPVNDQRCSYWQNTFDQSAQQDWEQTKWDILSDFKNRYGLALTNEEENALKYTHGEGRDHRKDIRVASPLAAHVHHCDNTSARIWHDQGKGLS